MSAIAGEPAKGNAKLDDYLHAMNESLRTKRVGATDRGEMLAELRSHLTERVAEFQADGAPDPLGRALAAFGDPAEIASEFAATANLRAAGRSFFPVRLLAAVWSMTRTFGCGLSLFVLGLAGYGVSLFALVAAVTKILLPARVGFWVGRYGAVWGLPPDGASGRELAGNWFIPISLWLGVFLACGTTIVLRGWVRAFLAGRAAGARPRSH